MACDNAIGYHGPTNVVNGQKYNFRGGKWVCEHPKPKQAELPKIVVAPLYREAPFKMPIFGLRYR